MGTSLLVIGLAGLFFVCGYFPSSDERHPKDEAVAAFVTACSAVILGCAAFIFLAS